MSLYLIVSLFLSLSLFPLCLLVSLPPPCFSRLAVFLSRCLPVVLSVRLSVKSLLPTGVAATLLCELELAREFSQ